MKLDKSLEPFRATIQSIQRLLAKYNDRGVIIGGIAVGLLGKPRFTADVDALFLLSTQDIPQFLELARAENITPRMQNAEGFAKKNRVLLLKHSPTDIDIDISLGILPFEEEVVERGITRTFANLSARLPTPEDLIILKAVAHRPKDLEDIRVVAGNFPNLDIRRIEQWVKAFADVLEQPELWEQIEPLLKSENPPKSS